MPLLLLPVLLAVAAGLSALALLGPVMGAAGVVAAQAAFLVAWSQLPVPSARRGAVLAALAAAAADAVLLRAPTAPLEALAPVLGIAVVAVFAVQLARRDGRAHVTTSASAAMSGALLAVAGACWLVASGGGIDSRVPLLVTAGALAAGALAAYLPVAAAWRCAAAAAVAAGAVLLLAPAAGRVTAAALAAGVAATTAAALFLLAEGYAGPVPWTGRRMRAATFVLAGTVPVLLAGPLLAASIRGLGG